MQMKPPFPVFLNLFEDSRQQGVDLIDACRGAEAVSNRLTMQNRKVESDKKSALTNVSDRYISKFRHIVRVS